MNIFVGNLDSTVTGDDLRETFGALGEVTATSVIMDRETGRSRSFGFVEMPNEEQARAAIEQINGKELNGRALRVSQAHAPTRERPAPSAGDRKSRPRRGSFGGPGSGRRGETGLRRGQAGPARQGGRGSAGTQE